MLGPSAGVSESRPTESHPTNLFIVHPTSCTLFRVAYGCEEEGMKVAAIRVSVTEGRHPALPGQAEPLEWSHWPHPNA